jgi:hypothetical protein
MRDKSLTTIGPPSSTGNEQKKCCFEVIMIKGYYKDYNGFCKGKAQKNIFGLDRNNGRWEIIKKRETILVKR